MSFTSRIEVDLTAIERNVAVIRRVLGGRTGAGSGPGSGPGICAVMKADGYGLGCARVAKRLAMAGGGVDMFAVYTPEQAKVLVDAGLPGDAPILVLMPIRELDRNDPMYRSLLNGQVHLTVHDASNLEAMIDIASALGVRFPVHVEVDTGMSRGGATPKDASALVARLAEQSRLRLAGIFTHCASADSDMAQTKLQADTFDRWLQENAANIPADCIIHQANTFGTFRFNRLHRKMVRVGLALLGFAGEEFADPEHFENAAAAQELVPAVRWVSKLVQTKWIAAGTPVGYGGTWKAKRRTRLGLIPVGYADGYPLSLSNKGRVGVELSGGVKAFVPVVGRVSMDQITVDLTDLPEVGLGVGSWVEVVGNDRSSPNHLPVLAKSAGTITHELLCRFSPRLARHYIAVDEVRPDTANDVSFRGRDVKESGGSTPINAVRVA